MAESPLRDPPIEIELADVIDRLRAVVWDSDVLFEYQREALREGLDHIAALSARLALTEQQRDSWKDLAQNLYPHVQLPAVSHENRG